ARGIRIHRHRLQHHVRTLAFRLLGRASVEAPVGKFFELREAGEFLDLSLAAQAGQWRVAVEPDVFQFVFGHREVGLKEVFWGCCVRAVKWDEGHPALASTDKTPRSELAPRMPEVAES